MFKNTLKNYFPSIYGKLSNLKFIYESFKYLMVIRNLYKSFIPAHSSSIKVVLNTVRGEALHVLLLESILAFKLKEMGCEVHILIDDGVLKHHDTVNIGDLYSRNDEIFRSKFVLNLLNKNGIYLKYSNLLSIKETEMAEDIANEMITKSNYTFEGIDLRPFIESSLIRFFKSGPLVVRNESLYKKYLKVFTENAVISALIASKVEEKLEPDIIITSHGIYTTWGPFYEFFKKRGKKTITYDFGGYHNNTVLFSKNGLVHNRNDDGFFNYFVNKDLSDVQKYRLYIEKVFEDRKKNLFPDQKSFEIQPDLIEKLDIIEDLKIKKRKKIFVMFPNVLWDGSLTGVDTIFKSPLEWILETINYFEEQDDRVLVIRAHPSESTLMKARKTLREMIEEMKNKKIDYFKNVLFIDSSSKLSSYRIFPFIDAAIVYNGTIGLELIHEDIPVLIAGRAPYSGKGFTLDFKTKEEYFEYLDNPNKVLNWQKINKNLFFMFAYQYFELNEIPLSFLSSDRRWTPKLDLPTRTILEDKNLNHIALTILEQRRYFQEWKNF